MEVYMAIKLKDFKHDKSEMNTALYGLPIAALDGRLEQMYSRPER